MVILHWFKWFFFYIQDDVLLASGSHIHSATNPLLHVAPAHIITKGKGKIEA